MRHTKGIWKIGKIKHSKKEHKGGYINIDCGGWQQAVRVSFTPVSLHNGMANAKLITAAPELLDALLSIVNTYEKSQIISTKQILAANKAIDKSTI